MRVSVADRGRTSTATATALLAAALLLPAGPARAQLGEKEEAAVRAIFPAKLIAFYFYIKVVQQM
jgi:hypothetical protein